jgi:hypothetical protein
MLRDPRHWLSALVNALLLVALFAATPASARSVLFVGNSFTFGAASPVKRYHTDRVTDLNGEGIGGVPALFATFAGEAGLDWTVSLETSPGKTLGFHLAEKRGVIDRVWDVVVLQGHSVLDPKLPGDGTGHLAAARGLSDLFRARNPQVEMLLMSTWSRADQVYRPAGHWHGQPIAKMAEDLLAVNLLALTPGGGIDAVLPVGTAWNRAMRDGVADDNPYDGIAFDQVSLWGWDQYHASAEGYYLEALVVFGMVTKLDPRVLDGKERAADDLGIKPDVAKRLREIAATELAFQGSRLRAVRP